VRSESLRIALFLWLHCGTLRVDLQLVVPS
jgi:hypothetical protein